MENPWKLQWKQPFPMAPNGTRSFRELPFRFRWKRRYQGWLFLVKSDSNGHYFRPSAPGTKQFPISIHTNTGSIQVLSDL